MNSCSGTFLPLSLKASCTMRWRPPQQGTSMRIRVMSLISLFLKILASFSMYAWTSCSLGHPLMATLPAMISLWTFPSEKPVLSAAMSSDASL